MLIFSVLFFILHNTTDTIDLLRREIISQKFYFLTDKESIIKFIEENEDNDKVKTIPTLLLVN